MEMQVIGVTDAGRIDNSDFTVRIFASINNPQVGAFVVSNPEEVRVLQTHFQCKCNSFLFVNEAGLAELQHHDNDIQTIGRFNSADITQRQIIFPVVD